MTPSHYYSEPIKNKFTFTVEKKSASGTLLDSFKFHSKDAAMDFLTQKNFYINGKLIHQSN